MCVCMPPSFVRWHAPVLFVALTWFGRTTRRYIKALLYGWYMHARESLLRTPALQPIAFWRSTSSCGRAVRQRALLPMLPQGAPSSCSARSMLQRPPDTISHWP
jgi:hypothetical protein